MDPRAHRLERLVRDHGRRAWAVARSLLRDGHEAQDAVQQALLVAARKIDRVPRDDPWPWFGVVVAHEARNLRRKRRPLATGDLLETDAAMTPREPPSGDPGRLSAQRDDARRVQAALDALPSDQRDAVALVHLGGMTHAAAAEALGVSRQTVTARLERGMRALERELARPPSAVAGALAVLPIAPPPIGWESALATWTQTAVASLAAPTAATTTALGGLALMSSKTLLALSLTAALGVGFLGGHVVTSQLSDGGPGASEADVALAPRVANANEPGPSSISADGDPALDPGAEPLRARARRLAAENADLRRRLASVAADRDALAAKHGDETAGGPTFTFGKAGALEAVRQADWPEMAAASTVVTDSIRTILEHKEAGTQAPKAVFLALQEHVERMRKYEYRTIGKMPTAAKHNGEITHPITVANLFAALLEDGGKPLRDEQITRIEQLGLRFEREFAAQRERHGDATPRVQRMLEEYRLKGRFMQDLAGVLDAEQQALVYDPATRGIAGLDLHDPTLMILHTSPVIAGESIDEIATKLAGILGGKLGLDDARRALLEGPLDGWKHDVRGILGPVPATRLKHYTYAQGEVAAAATVRLVGRLLAEVDLGPEVRAALLDDFAIYVPRIVAKTS